LLEALVELHREMAPDANISYEVHDGVLSGPLGERGRQLLHIVGEALTNVRRHSGAQNVGVSVRITEDKLWAEIRDDEGGFDAPSYSEEALSSSSGRMGLRGMRERARALGGDIMIERSTQWHEGELRDDLEEGPR
jgi:signal transduction histidine kinase